MTVIPGKNLSYTEGLLSYHPIYLPGLLAWQAYFVFEKSLLFSFQVLGRTTLLYTAGLSRFKVGPFHKFQWFLW